MTARPMTEVERARKVEEARKLVENFGKNIAYIMYDESDVEWARALLSTSAAERGMREALEALVGAADRYNSSGVYFNAGTNMEAALNKARASLSGIEGEDGQATRGEDAATATQTKEALEGCYALILRDYSDQRAAALEGHPIARDARDVWDKVCDALAALSSAPTTDTKGTTK